MNDAPNAPRATGIDFTRLYAQTRKLSANLAGRAWYFGPDMPMAVMHKLTAAFNAGDFDRIDKIMSGYIQHFLGDIKRQCEKMFPLRWPVLSSAFKAHKGKEYDLSIPVFLAQADGMCTEVFGVKFFQRRNRVPATASKLGDLEFDELAHAVLEPLRIGGGLSAYDNEPQIQGCLNRHHVLHGLSVKYGTEMNSLRAISLIGFLTSTIPFLQGVKEITPEKVANLKKVIHEAFKDLIPPGAT
jgi:hypothetical protein